MHAHSHAPAHSYTHISTLIHMRKHTHTHASTHSYTHIYTLINMHMHTHTRICTLIHTHATHTHASTHSHTCICTLIHTNLHTHTHTSMHSYTCICTLIHTHHHTHTHAYAHSYTRICTFIQMHVHTHTHASAPLMEPRDLVSVSRWVSWPILRVSVSKVSGLISVSKDTGRETLNIANKWFRKISIIQRFLFVIFAGKKQPKQVGKFQKLEKIQLRRGDNIF